MEKKASETFREYAHKWRDLAAQVQSPLTNKELNKMFIITVSRSTWNDKNQYNGVATNLFCLGVIGHRKVYLSIKIKIN